MNAKEKNALIDRLDEVALGKMYDASFKALMRLQMFMMLRTHEIMSAYAAQVNVKTLTAGGRDGTLAGPGTFRLMSDLMIDWADAFEEWKTEFLQARKEAARIAFGVGAVSHSRLIAPLSRITETAPQMSTFGGSLTESVVDGVYEPQLRILLGVAEEYLYGDGLNLSGRIWRIDQNTREGIQSAILNGVSTGASAYDIAKQIEQFLGAGSDCPRWTSTRLYGMTAAEKIDDPAGLLSGTDCGGSGVSYNALRLARTELQKIHDLATTRMMEQQPWVEQEQINLSPSHAETDVCDTTIADGEDGKGIYPVGTIPLPLHPNCLCYKTAVLMPEAEFSRRMKGWLDKSEPWGDMDAYANNLGVDLSTNLMPAALSLATWLFDDGLSLKAKEVAQVEL